MLENAGYIPFGEILSGSAQLDQLHITHSAQNLVPVDDTPHACETRGHRHGCTAHPDVEVGALHGHLYFEKHFPDLSCACTHSVFWFLAF